MIENGGFINVTRMRRYGLSRLGFQHLQIWTRRTVADLAAELEESNVRQLADPGNKEHGDAPGG